MVIPEPDRPPNERTWRGNFVTHAIAIVAAGVWRWNSDRAGQRPVLGRLTSHVALVLLFGFLLAWGSFHLSSPANTVSLAADPPLSPGDATPSLPEGIVVSAGTRSYQNAAASSVQIIRQAEPHTAIPVRPRLEIVTYIVQVGDTVESIARSFGLQPTTVLWSNPELERVPDLLKVGQELVILPLDGVYHTVAEGDTLESVAEQYKAAAQDIENCSFNHLPVRGALRTGMRLIVPNGTKPYEPRQVVAYQGPVPQDAVGTGKFCWPTSGYISQGYWYGHRAIDIANGVGTAILASDAGYVSFASWTDVGYGYLVVVDHANGYQTYYAHLSNIFVTEGEAVAAGQVIGAMGSTGHSTGPHLHFEVRYNGYPTNPWLYLP